MKYLFLISVLFLVGCNSDTKSSSPKNQNDNIESASQTGHLSFRNVDKWAVGDTLIYTVEALFAPGEIQYSVRKVMSDIGDAFWLCGDLGYSITDEMTTDCNTVHQFLVRKSDGIVIKQYTGKGGVDQGPYEKRWFVDSTKTDTVIVPLGSFSALHVSGRYYPAPPRADVIPHEKWYASNLPLDGLVQETKDFGHYNGRKQIWSYKLIKAIRGNTR